MVDKYPIKFRPNVDPGGELWNSVVVVAACIIMSTFLVIYNSLPYISHISTKSF